MRDTKRLIAIAAKLIVLGARYRFCCTAKRKEKLAERIVDVLAPMAAEIREEDRRDKETAVRTAQLRTVQELATSLRRQAGIHRERLRVGKIARTNRAKALAPLLENVADNLEKPPTTEKLTPVEDD